MKQNLAPMIRKILIYTSIKIAWMRDGEDDGKEIVFLFVLFFSFEKKRVQHFDLNATLQHPF